nr:hypothetical protein [uncultured Methanoregula sp.]
MTVRSVPITLGKDYDLRFEQEDMIACEEDLKMGYIFFFPTERINGQFIATTLSLKLCRTLIHHGLKIKDSTGDKFQYVFPQTPEGAKQAGDLIQNYLQNDGRLIEIWEKSHEAFSDWRGKPKEGKKAVDPEPTSKN